MLVLAVVAFQPFLRIWSLVAYRLLLQAAIVAHAAKACARAL